MENNTIKKASFYEDEESMTFDKEENQNLNTESNNLSINESNEDKNNEDNNVNENNSIIKELTTLISNIEKSLSDSNAIKKEEEEIKEGLLEFLAKFGIYYRGLAAFQANFQSFVEKYGQEEANGAAFQILNLMIDSAVKAEYYFSLLMKNALLNPTLPAVELQARINFMLEILFDVMKNNFNIENPKEEYVKLYQEILSQNL